MAEKEIFKNQININKSNNIQNKPQLDCNIKPHKGKIKDIHTTTGNADIVIVTNQDPQRNSLK